MEVSVIIPFNNQAAILKRNIAMIHSYLNQNYKTFEIIAIDDGSSDDTLKILTKLKIPELHIISYHKHRGRGYAIRKGIFASNGENIVCLDDIVSYSPTYIKACINSLNYCDITLASRYLYKGISYNNQVPKTLISKFYNFLIRLLLKIKTTDFECGFRGFKADIAREVFAKQELHKTGFELEMLKYAKQNDFNIVEFPIKSEETSLTKYSSKEFIKMMFCIFKLTTKSRGDAWAFQRNATAERQKQRNIQIQEKGILVCQ